MSRTFRKSSMDNSHRWFVRSQQSEHFTNFYKKRNRDGANGSDKPNELTKEHATWERRVNDKKIINDFYRGVDVEEIEYKDDRNLRGIIWNYD